MRDYWQRVMDWLYLADDGGHDVIHSNNVSIPRDTLYAFRTIKKRHFIACETLSMMEVIR